MLKFAVNVESALRLEAAGYDATDAKSLLRMMEWVLEAMETHRERIRQECRTPWLRSASSPSRPAEDHNAA